MTYIDGFVAAVPAANREVYRKHASDAVPLFKKLGASRIIECWERTCRKARSPISARR